jgi:DNA-binding NarL/FixJ family response regulator
MTAVQIVDDHEMVADSFRRLLEREDDFTVVAVSATGQAAVDDAQAAKPDVVLMDLGLPDMDGVTAAARILSIRPQARILILTGRGTNAAVMDALQAGCVGYLEKTSPSDRLVSAIRAAAAGELVLSAADLSRAVSMPAEVVTARGQHLTARELEVLELLAEGRSNQEIGDELYVSIHTIRAHIRTLLTKLGARSRLEAVASARRQNLISRG